MTKDEILLANKDFLFPAVFHYFQEPLVIEKATDQYVWDADGRRYLDFFGGILTISVGHCNDAVNAKIHAQVDKFQHVSTVFATEPQAALAKKIASITPGNLTKSFFSNSGTEANEMAILAARCYTGSTEIIALRHSYHGRSALAMAMTGQDTWRMGPPMPNGIVYAHNAYCYRCPFGLEYPSCELRCAKDMEEMIRTTTSGRVAGIIAEPIQGVGGFVTPPKNTSPSSRKSSGITAASSSAMKCKPPGAVLATSGSASNIRASLPISSPAPKVSETVSPSVSPPRAPKLPILSAELRSPPLAATRSPTLQPKPSSTLWKSRTWPSTPPTWAATFAASSTS